METQELLRHRLERALDRRDSAAPHGPEWAAAMAEVDDLGARLARLSILARAIPRVAVSA
jgi:hypothetical protein